MKNLLLILIVSLVNVGVYAQVRSIKTEAMDAQISQDVKWDSNVPTECFCCNEKIYNLPVNPIITGPQSVSCGTKATFSTFSCPGAAISWTISPSIPFTGDGTNTITVPATAPAGNYVISVSISCGNKSSKSQTKFSIMEVKDCTPAFLTTVVQLANGSLAISTVPTMQIPGQEHWWGIQYNGTYPNCNLPCESIPFDNFKKTSGGVWGGYINSSGILTPYMGSGITTGTTPYGIYYSGFQNNVCFRVTHYVRCCGVLKRQTHCVSFGTAANKMAGGQAEGTPIISIGKVENAEN